MTTLRSGAEPRVSYSRTFLSAAVAPMMFVCPWTHSNE